MNRAAIAAVTIGVSVALAAPAQATPNEYISFLRSQGVPIIQSDNAMLDLGYAACTELRAHVPLTTIGVELMSVFTSDQAASIVVGAAAGLCPDTIPYIKSQIKKFNPQTV